MTETDNIYQKILRDPILSRAFRHIATNNTSNYAPYHHFHHMMCVTKWSMILAEAEGIAKGSAEWYELMLASMFHDMNHSMGKLTDEENVKNSVNEYILYHAHHVSFKSEAPISEHGVSNTIFATQYPYVIADEDLNRQQAIIRDADLLVSLEPDWFQNAFLGLMNEMGVDEIQKMIAGQKAFHLGIQMRTETAKELYETRWPNQCIETIELLENLYND